MNETLRQLDEQKAYNTQQTIFSNGWWEDVSIFIRQIYFIATISLLLLGPMTSPKQFTNQGFPVKISEFVDNSSTNHRLASKRNAWRVR